jgi:uncharacterized repeat protein (TIGR03803 family)
MYSNKFWAAMGKVLAVVTVTCIVVLLLAPGAWAASKYKVLHRFTHDDGYGPYAALILDATGNLYGTTPNGGASNWGVVFKLSPNADGSWTESVLYSFTGGDDGSYPDHPSLVFDAVGNLYGTTYGGGGVGDCSLYGQGCGTVFKLTHNADGSWTESVLHSFTNDEDGGWPQATLIFDAEGSLYGTTTQGGANGHGTVFQLTPNPDGTWTENVLYSFTGGRDGANPWTGVVFDQAGNLYGAAGGGTHGHGVMFKLTPNPDGSWTESVLHQLRGSKDGANPGTTHLVLDTTGSLYGTTGQGGAYGYGNVFKLTPNPDGSWTESVLHQFKGGKDGGSPWAGVFLDAAGKLYGTTVGGGAYGYGVVFKLTPKPSGGWTEQVLHAFQGTPAAFPYAGPVLDGAGNLYAATRGSKNGAVYEIKP